MNVFWCERKAEYLAHANTGRICRENPAPFLVTRTRALLETSRRERSQNASVGRKGKFRCGFDVQTVTRGKL